MHSNLFGIYESHPGISSGIEKVFKNIHACKVCMCIDMQQIALRKHLIMNTFCFALVFA